MANVTTRPPKLVDHVYVLELSSAEASYVKAALACVSPTADLGAGVGCDTVYSALSDAGVIASDVVRLP